MVVKMAQISNIEQLKAEFGFEVFPCGSQRLSHEIRTKLNLLPIKCYENSKGKVINVYIMTKQLSEFLVEWSAKKPKVVKK